MADPSDLEMLRLLRAFREVEDQKTREIIIMIAEASAHGAEIKAKTFRPSAERPSKDKLN